MNAIRSAIALCAGLLCVAFAAAWVRSHGVNDVILFGHSRRGYWEVATVPGHLRITSVQTPGGPEGFHWFRGSPPPGVPVFGQQAIYRTGLLPGFGFVHVTRRMWSLSSPSRSVVIARYRTFATPFPVPVAFTGLIALFPWLRARRLRRVRAERAASGLCMACGYDLRSSTGRCPECGCAIASALSR